MTKLENLTSLFCIAFYISSINGTGKRIVLFSVSLRTFNCAEKNVLAVFISVYLFKIFNNFIKRHDN